MAGLDEAFASDGYHLADGTDIVLTAPPDEAGLAAERARLDKELAKVRETVSHLERKLSNPRFVERAPEAVVNKERTRLDEARADLSRYEAQRAALG